MSSHICNLSRSTLVIVSLVLALMIGMSSALPLRLSRQSGDLPTKRLHSIHTGQFVFIHEDGNVTAMTGPNMSAARFLLRIDGDKIAFESVDYIGRFLHFAQVNASSNATTHSADNATADTDVELVLQVSELLVNDSSDVIQHHQWSEEDVGGNFRTYSVMLGEGKICYLAFESDGKPVEDPCVDKEEVEEELNKKELITKILFDVVAEHTF